MLSAGQEAGMSGRNPIHEGPFVFLSLDEVVQ